MQKVKPTAVVFDAFGTLIRFGDAQHNPYRHFLKDCGKDPTSRWLFPTRNVSADVIADELYLLHVMPEFRRELDEELAGLRLFDEVPTVITKVHTAGRAQQPGFRVWCRCAATSARRRCSHPEFRGGRCETSHMIYAATCKALQCAPNEVVFIGDSKRCDVHGAQEFGMQAR